MSDSIRLALAHDAAALHRIAEVTFPFACTPETSGAEQAAYIAQHLSEAAFEGHLVDPARRLLIAVDDEAEQAVGYSVLTTDEPTDPDVVAAIRIRPTVELSRMYVHPARHGTGLADRLMSATLEAARVTGAAGVWLGVSVDNERANAFYARHGFAEVGTKRFHLGDRWEDDFVRERALG